MPAHLPDEIPGHAEAVRYARAHSDSIRRIISSRLGLRLRQVFGPEDIEQSLLRTLLQQPQPPTPLAEHELRRLVLVIALRLVLAKARDEHPSRWESPVDLEKRQGTMVDPAEQAAARDVIHLARELAGDDWSLVEARLEGRTFPELASSLGSTPDALRMRWRRAIDRITEQFRENDDG